MNKLFTVTLSIVTLLSFSATAADLRVRVFERGVNVPLQGVAVCLGTQARLDQFGAVRTDESGYALFSGLPRAQVVVTASMPGFMSAQENMVTSNVNRMLVMTMSGGGGGARCPISEQGDGLSAGGLHIKQFTINKGASTTSSRTIKLNNKLTGMATQYRASEQADLADSEWQYYAAAPEFTLSSGAGVKQVYLQVRRHATVNGATMETVSPVVRDSIRIR